MQRQFLACTRSRDTRWALGKLLHSTRSRLGRDCSFLSTRMEHWYFPTTTRTTTVVVMGFEVQDRLFCWRIAILFLSSIGPNRCISWALVFLVLKGSSSSRSAGVSCWKSRWRRRLYWPGSTGGNQRSSCRARKEASKRWIQAGAENKKTGSVLARNGRGFLRKVFPVSKVLFRAERRSF